MKQPRTGFTLIELSIALVLIGLIVGGVMMGRDLIRAAQRRVQIGQIEKYDTAVIAFREKFRCLPGDCTNPIGIGVVPFGGPATNGDGNGIIDVKMEEITTDEPSNFWYHLDQTSLISSGAKHYPDVLVPGIDTPALKLPGEGVGGWSGTTNPAGGMWIIPLNANALMDVLFAGNKAVHGWFLTATSDYGSGPGIYMAGDLYAIDTKIDDGLPLGGNMRVVNYILHDGPVYASSDPNSCVNDLVVPARYNLTSVAPNKVSTCAPVIATKF